MRTIHRRCDSFDLICGTGTGGLIAIMLGSGKSIQECIEYLTKASRKAERETAISKCIENLKSVRVPAPNESPFICVTAVKGQDGEQIRVHDRELPETTVAVEPFFEPRRYFVSTE